MHSVAVCDEILYKELAGEQLVNGSKRTCWKIVRYLSRTVLQSLGIEKEWLVNKTTGSDMRGVKV